MALTGIDPNDPTPANRRELIVAAGESAGSAPENKVLLLGNKTSAGSETVDTLGTFVLSEQDAIDRMGPRSELYAMYRKFREIDANGQLFFIAVLESAGTNADADFTFASGPATGPSSVEVTVHGEVFEVPVEEGDLFSDVAAAVNTRIPNVAEGRLQVTSSVLAGAVTVTYVHGGPRGDLVIGDSATRGVRMRFTKDVGITIVKGALTAGTTDDDGTLAFAAAAASEFGFWVLPWHATATVVATDNQIGEAISGANGVRTAALPITGKEQTAHVGLVGTQAEATAVATSAAANASRAYFYRAENSDLSPAMIAAHHAGVSRSLVQSHPAMPGAVGYTLTDQSPYIMPDPFVKDDRPTSAEITADLNNGVTPITFDSNGTARISRIITSRSLNSAGDNDYRAREGHITYVTDFFWGIVEQKYSELLQPFIDDDPAEGQTPTSLTTTPTLVSQIIKDVITDLVSDTPLGEVCT